jgi:predicted metalloprotease with PDZ domain
VLLFVELDQEIAKASGGKKSIDDVTRMVLKTGQRVSVADLKAAASKVLGRPSKVLESPLIR